MGRLSRAATVMLLLGAALPGCAPVPLAYPEVAPAATAPWPSATDLEPRPVVALVLGGGASRGFAHVGVIQELERNGIAPRIVVGTSAGSFVGALYAGGHGGAALRAIAAGLEEDDLSDMVVPDRGFIKGERLQDFVNRRLNNRSIEQLPRRFAAVVTDLRGGGAVAFNRGNTGMAVRASSSIPGVFQPVTISGRDYVDGGLVSPVPVRVARAMGADVVIAVDVARRPEHAGELKTTVEVVVQAVAIMGKYVGDDERAEADILIRPDVNGIGALDFEHRQLAIDAGERAARAALPAIHTAISSAAQRLAR